MSARSRSRRSSPPATRSSSSTTCSTGHRDAVPDGAGSRAAPTPMAPRSSGLLEGRADRGHPPLRGAVAGRRVDRATRRVLPRQRRRRRRPARGGARSAASGGSSSRRPRRSTASRTPRRSPRTPPLRPINPYGETKRTFEGALAWYGRGLRPAQRDASATSTSPARPRRSARTTTPRPTSSRTSSRAAEGGRADRSSATTTRRPTGPASATTSTSPTSPTRTCAALEATAPGDPRTDEPLVCNLGNGGGFWSARSSPPPRRVVGRPIPYTVGPRRAGDPPVLVARATTAAAGGPRAGGRHGPSLEEMVGSAWAWRRGAIRDGYPD